MVVVCVIGCGTLGSRIAGELCMCGHLVRVWDTNQYMLDRLPDQLNFEREQAMEGGVIMSGVLGEVSVFTDLEEAVKEASIVIEAVVEDLEVKKEIMKKASKLVDRSTVITSSTLRLPLDEIFSGVIAPERSIGLRFLFPVYAIPEVELTPWDYTDKDTVLRITQWLERMGKTAFLRSGPEPLILSEEERELRWKERALMVSQNRGLGGRVVKHLPSLAHRGNFAPPQDDETKFSNRISIEQECIICMDSERACLLAPCHHLATCQDCGELLLGRRDACPVCRTTISDIIHFYRS